MTTWTTVDSLTTGWINPETAGPLYNGSAAYDGSHRYGGEIEATTWGNVANPATNWATQSDVSTTWT